MIRRKAQNPSALGRPASPTEGAAEAIALVSELKKKLKYSDTALASLIDVDQSSVNRALRQTTPRLTPTLRKLCSYAESNLPAATAPSEKAAKEQLAGAIVDAWDGTADGLKHLLALLKVLGCFVSRK